MKYTLEEGIRRLEEIRQELGKEEISLEQMVVLYKEGMELSRELTGLLDAAEKDIIKIEGEFQDERNDA